MTRVSVAPAVPDWAAGEIAGCGAEVVPPGPATEGLVWLGFHDPAGLREALARAPRTRWVQLPSAGVDDYAEAGVLDPAITWTSAKGAYARPVAEHALALTLALLRRLHERARATSWGEQAGTSLHGLTVVVVGAGGVARELVRLLQPFGTRTVVVRRRAEPVEGADRTVTSASLHAELASADVVVVAAALTSSTRALVGAAELGAMRPEAVLVNVARGPVVDTEALGAALADGRLAGAALDVTDPEPLPDGHPLWDEPRALITPHTADTAEMVAPLLRARVATNVRRFVSGEPLEGVVDAAAGY
ncbi:NAD(P)-dependent oxidoreductase [Cellulosimicrobium sp. CUA-896]|uniref:NAD(P)-dependent oxidoreductase n=1 Tax=Cellulosimicrobium sp. CUA-896 TaxID=1517881 RepID=UPI00095A40AB|nr:NAD(P)-dependent oxidoreductase [Cellulosimicrobium sp. CUA-896]OLT54496.1 hydroxyacid dehydrogenase [Cellulosimicrobium sp. CUA-896]